MSDPWSNNPNAPRISSRGYAVEKGAFVGGQIGAVIHGIAVALFFRCIGALINPVNTMKKSIKWGLVAHTVALFSFSTAGFMMNQFMVFPPYIDHREFPGIPHEFPPGPIGYNDPRVNTGPYVGVYFAMFPLGQWLADGLLLHRCFVIFCMSYRVMIFPCLLYITSVVIGITNIYYFSVLEYRITPLTWEMAIAYYSISLLLNILLTLMIITRLVLHKRNIRHAMGTLDGTTKLYTTIIMMLVESYALYAIAFALYIVSFALDPAHFPIFSRILAGIQLIAPYLVILRVAERRALTSEIITSGSDVGSIRFRSQGTTDGNGSLPDHDPGSSTQAKDVAPKGENGIEEVPL